MAAATPAREELYTVAPPELVPALRPPDVGRRRGCARGETAMLRGRRSTRAVWTINRAVHAALDAVRRARDGVGGLVASAP
jgi:hypothetical protein